MEYRRENKKIIRLLDLIILLLVLFIINFFVYNNSKRIDLTSTKFYTLSKGTKNILSQLDDRVNIICYFSKNLPPYLKVMEKDIKDILDEYRIASKGKVIVKFIDPEIDKNTENKAKGYGIPKIQMNYFDNEKIEVKQGYLGIVILYKDKHEVIPVVSSIENLEYELSSKIKKLMRKNPIEIGYLNLDGSPKMEKPSWTNPNPKGGPLSILKDFIEKNYKLVILDKHNKNGIPSSIKTLIIVNPKTIDDRTLFEIDQFLLSGGNLIIFDNSFVRNGIQGVVKTNRLNKLLNNAGLNEDAGVVADRVCDKAVFGSGMFQVITDYPFFVKIMPENINRELPVTSQLQSVTFPWPSPVSVIDSIIKRDSLKVYTLFKSSRFTTIRRYSLSFDPQQHFKWDTSGVVLAALVKGKFRSIFDKYVPYDSTDNTNPPIIKRAKNNSMIILVASGEMPIDMMLKRFPENLNFVFNLIDYSSQDEDLINIRSKKIVDRPLKNLTPKEKLIIKYANIILTPILIIIIGIGYNVYRNRKKYIIEKTK